MKIERIEFIDGHADVWALFRDGPTLRSVVDALASPLQGVDKIAGIEARGFILGAAVAAEIGVGFAAIRKAGGLYPGAKVEASTGTPDYRGHTHRLRLQTAAISPGERVALVDDWVETGNQATAARALIESCGGTWAGLSVVVNQLPAERLHLLAPLWCCVTEP